MTINSVEVKKYGPNHVEISIDIDGDTITKKLTIPDKVKGVAPKKEFMRRQARRMIHRHTKQAERDAQRDSVWDKTPTDAASDAVDILTDLQNPDRNERTGK